MSKNKKINLSNVIEQLQKCYETIEQIELDIHLATHFDTLQANNGETPELDMETRYYDDVKMTLLTLSHTIRDLNTYREILERYKILG